MDNPQTAPVSDGALSLDAAIDLLAREPEEEQAEAKAPEPAQPEAKAEEPPVADEPEIEPDAEIDVDELLAEDAEPEAPKEPEIPPPVSWSKDDAATWAALTPEARAVVAKREADRDRAVSLAMQEKAAALKELNEISAELQEWAPKALQIFQDRWQGATPEWWAQLAQQDPQQYWTLKAQFDAEREQAGKLQAEAARTQEASHRAFLAEEAKKLAEVAPELVDPKMGEARRKAVAEFLVQNGIEPDALSYASAAELKIASLALDGMKWREAQAKARAKASEAPKQQPAPTRPARPIAPATSGIPSKGRELQGLEARLTKTGSLDAAVDLLMARGQSPRR